jgi:hypothetical protein
MMEGQHNRMEKNNTEINGSLCGPRFFTPSTQKMPLFGVAIIHDVCVVWEVFIRYGIAHKLFIVQK